MERVTTDCAHSCQDRLHDYGEGLSKLVKQLLRGLARLYKAVSPPLTSAFLGSACHSRSLSLRRSRCLHSVSPATTCLPWRCHLASSFLRLASSPLPFAFCLHGRRAHFASSGFSGRRLFASNLGRWQAFHHEQTRPLSALSPQHGRIYVKKQTKPSSLSASSGTPPSCRACPLPCSAALSIPPVRSCAPLRAPCRLTREVSSGKISPTLAKRAPASSGHAKTSMFAFAVCCVFCSEHSCDWLRQARRITALTRPRQRRSPSPQPRSSSRASRRGPTRTAARRMTRRPGGGQHSLPGHANEAIPPVPRPSTKNACQFRVSYVECRHIYQYVRCHFQGVALRGVSFPPLSTSTPCFGCSLSRAAPPRPASAWHRPARQEANPVE